MKKSEPEFILGPPLSQEYIDQVRWMRDKIWQDMMDMCCIPKELLYPNGKAKKTKAEEA